MAGPFTLKPLPWAEDALAPTISARTISFHYHKHHKAYVDKLNKLVENTRYAGMPLEQIVQATASGKDAKDKQIFNNAGQVWNHDFFWRSLTPKGGRPSGKLQDAIARDFGRIPPPWPISALRRSRSAFLSRSEPGSRRCCQRPPLEGNTSSTIWRR